MMCPALVARLQTLIGRARTAVWGLLMRRWLYVLGAVLGLLVTLIVFSGKKSQDVKEDALRAVGEVQLTRRQTKQLKKTLAVEQQKRAVAVAVAVLATQTADSAVHVAQLHDAKADSVVRVLVQVLKEGSQSDTADVVPLTRLQASLSTYRPGAYALPDGDSIK